MRRALVVALCLAGCAGASEPHGLAASPEERSPPSGETGREAPARSEETAPERSPASAASSEAVRAFFAAHAGCDPRCAASDPDAEGTSLYLTDPRRLASVPFAGGEAQLWSVGWANSGPDSGTELVLVVPTASAPEEAERDDVWAAHELFPAAIEGHTLVAVGALAHRSEQDVIDARDAASEPRLEVDGGVLRVSFEVIEQRSWLVAFEECEEVERGPRFRYRVETLCSARPGGEDAREPCGRSCVGEGCPARTCDAGGALTCRSLVTARSLLAPGGLDDCRGPAGPRRRPTPEEARAVALSVEVVAPDRVRVTGPSPDAGEVALDAVRGLPPLELVCPLLGFEQGCDDEERARYDALVGAAR